jgi:nuclear mRNA export protein PCID2/THP1
MILIFLIAASMPIGILPTPRLLRAYALEQIFGPLVDAVRTGNFELLSRSLYGDNREWLRAHGIWLLLQERLETLCWRVFIRKCFVYTYLPLRAVNPAAHTSISLDTLAGAANPFLGAAARWAGRDEFLEWDTFDIFGVCINLIDQGYIKGQVLMDKRRILTLPKMEPWGFVRVSEVKVNSRVTGIQMLGSHTLSFGC